MSRSDVSFFVRFRQWLFLTSCVGGLAALAACGTDGFIREQIYGERPYQMVVGPRRAPLLNPAAPAFPVEHIGQATLASAAPLQPDKPQANAELTPFDQYDENGEIRTNYLKEWFGSEGEKVAASGALPQQHAMIDDSVRKPFPGNPPLQDEAVGFVPIVPTPVLLEREQQAPQQPAAVTQPVSNQYEPAKAVDDAIGNGVIIVPEPQHRAEIEEIEMVLAQVMPSDHDAAAEKPVPDLSSVPPVPSQFEGVKATKDKQLEELQLNHDAAQEEKKKLDEEPTQLSPVSFQWVDDVVEEVQLALLSPDPIVSPEEMLARERQIQEEKSRAQVVQVMPEPTTKEKLLSRFRVYSDEDTLGQLSPAAGQ